MVEAEEAEAAAVALAEEPSGDGPSWSDGPHGPFAICRVFVDSLFCQSVVFDQSIVVWTGAM